MINLKYMISCSGHSKMRGHIGSTPWSEEVKDCPPFRLAQNLGRQAHVTNYGISSSTMLTTLNTTDTKVFTIQTRPLKDTSLIPVWIYNAFGNDIGSVASLAELTGRIDTLIAAVRTEVPNVNIIMCTETSRKIYVDTAGQESLRLGGNAHLRNNYNSLANKIQIADIDASPLIGGPTSYLNMTYQDPDYTHWTKAANQVWADIVAPLVLNTR